MSLFNKKYRTLTDEQLMELVAEKDKQAFSELYDRYSTALVNYFFRMLWKDREKSEDFMHDLFTKLIQKPHLYQSGRNFKTWLYSIANNMCKNEYRKQEVRKNTVNMDTPNAMGEDGSEAIRSMDRKDFDKELELALAELDEKKRAVFEMRFHEDLSIKEISEALECSEGTVKSRIFYTIKFLNGKLKHFEKAVNAILLIICSMLY
jgi:RNA polymerase sigma-70 factor (ECF subfamily)